MNPIFNNWLMRTKGIGYEQLQQKSENEKQQFWKEYMEYKNEKAREYNRQFEHDW